MKITDITCHVLVADDVNPGLTSSAQDSLLVVVTTDEGLEGYGESDLNPWIGRACIEASGTHTMGLGMAELLKGKDPRDIEALWDHVYTMTAMNGRRGAVIHALGAVEMALRDLAGKIAGEPLWKLLGEPRPTPLVPYASLQPAGSSFEAYRDALCESAENAKKLGFKAVKAECTMAGPYAHDGMNESYDRHTEVVAAVRRTLGPDMTLMVDVQYLWRDAETAWSVLRDWEEFDLYFVETPIWPDFLDEHARLADQGALPDRLGGMAFDPLGIRGSDRTRPDRSRPAGRRAGWRCGRGTCGMCNGGRKEPAGGPALLEDGCVTVRHRPSRLRNPGDRLCRVSSPAAVYRKAPP